MPLQRFESLNTLALKKSLSLTNLSSSESLNENEAQDSDSADVALRLRNMANVKSVWQQQR